MIIKDLMDNHSLTRFQDKMILELVQVIFESLDIREFPLVNFKTSMGYPLKKVHKSIYYKNALHYATNFIDPGEVLLN